MWTALKPVRLHGKGILKLGGYHKKDPVFVSAKRISNANEIQNRISEDECTVRAGSYRRQSFKYSGHRTHALYNQHLKAKTVSVLTI